MLQGMSEEQIGEVFGTMLEAVRTGGAYARQQEGQLGVPRHAQPAPPTGPSPEQIREQMKAWLDPNSDQYDPLQAFNQFAQQNYGPLLGDINRRSIMGVMESIGRQLPDWNEHRNDVATVLAQVPNPAAIREQDILDVYLRVKGWKDTQNLITKARTSATTTQPPSAPRTEDATPKIELNEMEKTVARALYPGADDPIASYIKDLGMDGTLEMKVPGGGGKKV